MEQNLLFTGVGGQGVILAAKVVGEAATAAGHETRVGEIHGMSQRGGSVVAHVRYGNRVYGPMVPEGKANVVVALEPMEALRYANYLKPGGLFLVNFEPEMPFPVEQGEAEYPDEAEIREALEARGRLVEVPALELATEAGIPKGANAVLLGALSTEYDLGLDVEQIREALLELVPDDARESNRDAFELGREGQDPRVETRS
ncbi:MAG: indolepyruvate oxidoreductase subunit beta [Halodesulfurarchaeum sp.]